MVVCNGGGSNEGVRTDTLVLSTKTTSRQLQEQEEKDRIEKALAFAQKTTDALVGENSEEIRFQAAYPINDLPNMVRGKLQSGGFLREVMEEFDTFIVKKGVYFDPKLKYSVKLKEGDEPLYLLIIGKTNEAVRETVRKLNETKNEIADKLKARTSSIGAVL